MKLSVFLKRTFCSLISLHTALCEGANCLERLGELRGEGTVIIFKVPRSADISSEQKPDCFHVPAYFHCQDFMPSVTPRSRFHQSNWYHFSASFYFSERNP